jgi:hypothetical protein
VSIDLDTILDELAQRVAARLAESNGKQAPAEPEAWRLLDVEDVATMLGRSTRWVRERVRRGDLAHVRLDGGALAFDPEDVRAFARARRVGGSEREA